MVTAWKSFACKILILIIGKLTMTLKDVLLFKDLLPKERLEISKILREKSFKKGEILFFEGEACVRMFIVQTGRIKVYRTNAAARVQTLNLLEPGDTCACNPGCGAWACSASAKALSPCKVWYFSRKDFADLVKEMPKVSQALNSLLANKILKLSSLIEEVSLKTVNQRLANFILELRRKNIEKGGKGLHLHLQVTREEIAQRIGAARESVARNLHRLKRAGTISLGPNEIGILDLAALENIGAG